MIKSKISVIATMLLIGSSAFAGVWTNTGKITGTPHDLSATNADGNNELCVYCHTPHAGNSAFTGAPLWNKAGADAATTYRLYGASANDTNGVTIAGTQVGGNDGNAAGDLSSPSLACLSCHDGVSAIDSILNAPGSGMNTKPGTMTMIDYMATSVTANGNIGAGGLANVDLSNDHPVSVQYNQNRASLKDPTTVLTNWVGANQISDLLRGPNNDMVECSSCHDPHNGYTATADRADLAAAPQVNYLRMSNANSALCLGCHDK